MEASYDAARAPSRGFFVFRREIFCTTGYLEEDDRSLTEESLDRDEELLGGCNLESRRQREYGVGPFRDTEMERHGALPRMLETQPPQLLELVARGRRRRRVNVNLIRLLHT